MQCPIWGRQAQRRGRLSLDHSCNPAPSRRHHFQSRSAICLPQQGINAHRSQLSCRCAATAVAEGERAADSEAPAASQPSVLSPETKAHWYAVIANSDFMLHDVQNESFAEQLRERRRMFGEQDRPIDFFLVPEPGWLDSKFAAEGKRVGRPSLAVVSPDKTWITFMKLRLDRVLKLDLGEMTMEEATKSVGTIPKYGPLDKDKWTAPYAPYRPGWWEMFIPSEQQQQ